LGPKFYGPFLITERVSDVAYCLQLPAGAKLHDVFHAGLLKKYKGDTPVAPGVLPPICHGRACPEPESIRGRRELLVRWVGQDPAGASWVDLEEFQLLYPSFNLEDDLGFEGGRYVMVGLRHSR
jgi:hypothetical protein